MNENRPQRLAYAAMLFNIIAWGMSWVSVRTVLTELDAGQVGAMRYLIASAVMLPVWLWRGRPLPARSDLLLVALLGLFGFCFYNLGVNFGEKTVDAGTGSLLISFQPILVIVIGVLLRREVVSLVAWIGILISMAGVIMTAIGSSAGLTLNFGTILILGAALSSAIQTLINKALTRRYHALDVTTWAIWIGTIGLLPFSHDLPEAWGRLSTNGLLHLVFLGVVPAALCYTLFAWVLTRVPIATAMSAVYAIPVFSLVFGWSMLGEQPTTLTLIGGAVTIVGVAWVQLLTRKEKP
ncbi:MAG: DMT family transporter [Verrucomicrobia bacterium]|nr:DMT family transporter [Verrucomicrobiota bacterium]